MSGSVNLSGIDPKLNATQRRTEVRKKLLDTIQTNYMQDGRLTQAEIKDLQTKVKSDKSLSGEDATLLEASLELMAKYNKAYARLDLGSTQEIDQKDLDKMRSTISKVGVGFGDLDKDGALKQADKNVIASPEPVAAQLPLSGSGTQAQKVKSLLDNPPAGADGSSGITLYDKDGNEVGTASKLPPGLPNKASFQIAVKNGGKTTYHVFDEQGKFIGTHEGSIQNFRPSATSQPGDQLLARVAKYEGTATEQPPKKTTEEPPTVNVPDDPNII